MDRIIHKELMENDLYKQNIDKSAEMTIGDILNTLNPDQKIAVMYLIDQLRRQYEKDKVESGGSK